MSTNERVGNEAHAPPDPDRPGMICHVCHRQINPIIGYQVDAPGKRRHPECCATPTGGER